MGEYPAQISTDRCGLADEIEAELPGLVWLRLLLADEMEAELPVLMWLRLFLTDE